MGKIRLQSGDVLIMVDIQPTFMPGGGLPVPRGKEVVPVALKLCELFSYDYVNTGDSPLTIIATQDLHPYGHISFASSYHRVEPGTLLTPAEIADWDDSRIKSNLFSLQDLRCYLDIVREQVVWSDHAVRGSAEAQLPREIRNWATEVVTKGMNPITDCYSGFRDLLGNSTGLDRVLERRKIERVFISGLAYDYCVAETALDSAELGYRTYIIEDATRRIGNSVPKLGRLESSFRSRGVRLVNSADLSVPGSGC